MDPRTQLCIAGLLATALAGGCSLDDRGAAAHAALAFARQAFRATTQLIRFAVPPKPPAVYITMGVRG